MTSPSFRHIGVVVNDLNKSIEFWQQLFGLTIKNQQLEEGEFVDNMLGLSGVKLTTVKLAGPDGMLVELLKFHSHPAAESWTGNPFSTGLTHIALTVEDIESCDDKIRALGYAAVHPPQTSPDNKVRVAYFRGPENLLLELVEEL